MLSQGAFNALLKILEEPPAHVIFILATTEIHKVPETIISRCQRFDFSKFTVEEIIEKLSAVAKKEKIKIDKEATGLIALMAEGGMRDAESLLEQIITLEKNDITSKKIEALLGVSGIKSIEKMTDLVFAGKTGEALIFVNKIYRDGYNLEIFSKSWLDYLRKMMLFKAGPELEKQIFSSLTKEQRESLKNLSARTGAKNLLVLIDRLSESIPKIKTSFIPQLPLEYLIVDLTGKSEEKNDFSGKSGGNDPDNDSEKKNGAEKSPKNYSSSADTEKKDISKKIEKEGAESKAVVKNPPIDINEIKKSWPEIIGEIGKHNYSLSMALSNSLLIENSDYGTIGIVVRHAFHKEILNKPENRLTIKNISNKITGLNFRVQAVTEAESGVKLKSIFTEDNIAQKDGIDDNSQGSLLADAMNLMGGTVVK
jgi:DNA polymerase-3 subunit gamma/tau